MAVRLLKLSFLVLFATASATAQRTVVGENYDVVLPADYDSTRSYPLLIILHGAFSDKESLQPYFVPDLFADHYVRIFPQSSERSRDGYTWHRKLKEGRKIITSAYEQVIRAYPIDTSRVIVCGFSMGGMMAIDVTLQQVVPLLGFIAVCPGMPTQFDSSLVAGMVARGQRGVIIGGHTDYFRPYQLDMISVFKATGFDHRFLEFPNLGHVLPPRLPQSLDAAVSFVDPGVRKSSE